jgi:hypothetical protein
MKQIQYLIWTNFLRKKIYRNDDVTFGMCLRVRWNYTKYEYLKLTVCHSYCTVPTRDGGKLESMNEREMESSWFMHGIKEIQFNFCFLELGRYWSDLVQWSHDSQQSGYIYIRQPGWLITHSVSCCCVSWLMAILPISGQTLVQDSRFADHEIWTMAQIARIK